ncbi:hypothetical protein BC829DRAFT_387247 [Chytridium lagenaria]|nr:hypothetical protein BC829DRAFT_387247 [Chytridium lagenaria]
MYMRIEKLDAAFMCAETMIKVAATASKGYLLAGKLLRMRGFLKEALDLYVVGSSKVSKYDPGYAKLALYKQEIRKHLGIEDKENSKEEAKSKGSKKPVERKRLRRISEDTSKPADLPQVEQSLNTLEGISESSANPLMPDDDAKSALYLPAEIFMEVCKHLTTKELCRLLSVNRRTKNTVSSLPSVWSNLEFCASGGIAPKNLTPLAVGQLINNAKSRLKSLILGRWPRANPGVLKVLTRHKPNLVRFEMCGAPNVNSNTIADAICLVGKLQLSVLVLDDTGVSSAGVNLILQTCNGVTELSLRNCNVGGPAFKMPEGRKLKIRRLILEGCIGVGVDTLESVATTCPDLEDLDLSGSSNVNAVIFRHLSSCIKLRSLKLHRTALHTCSGPEMVGFLETFVSAFPNGQGALRSFGVSKCPSFNDDALRVLAEACPEMEDLELSTCANITDIGAQAIARHFVGLKKLNLEQCFRVTDEGASTIVKSCGGLVVLEIGLTQIRDGFLKTLCGEGGVVLPKLVELNITNCSGITGSAVLALVKQAQKALPSLRKLVLNGNSQISNEFVSLIKAAAAPSITVSCLLSS